jgi:hypothetical protein
MKGRIEFLAVIFMLLGAAPGAQIGTIATKYIRGYGIRLMFGTTVVCAMISVILKQMGLSVAATWMVMAAVSIMTLIVIVGMFKGAAGELKAKRSSHENRA